ncbi:SLAC1 family transporter [Amycolatopsis sp. NPDC004368]
MTSTAAPTPSAEPAGTPPARTAPGRFPLTTFAIAFGLVGLAGVWTRAAPALGLPRVVPQVFWVIAAVSWVWLLVAHTVRGRKSGQPLVAQLRHPAQGPLASLAPVVAMLLANDLFPFSHVAGRMLFFLALVTSAVFAAWILAWWLEGRLGPDAVHAGYILPTVAPGLIGGDVARSLGHPGLSWGLFAIGVLFTLLMTPLIIQRLGFHNPLPEPLLPTSAMLLAPPPVAGLAWFTVHGFATDPVGQGIAGIVVLMLLVQVALLPRYRRLPFTLGFWSFTFPLAASVSLTEKWLQLLAPAGWRAWTGVLAIAFTVFIAVIGAFSLRPVLFHPKEGPAK